MASMLTLRSQALPLCALCSLRVPNIREVDVLILGRALGYDSLGTLCCHPGAGPSAFLLFWK